MRKILGLVMSLLIVFSTVSTVLAEESNECLLCHGTKVFECPENDCTKGNFCLTCMDYSWTGYSGICSTCRGTGTVKKNKTITITIPEGIDTDNRLRVAGKGEAGANGGKPGDLYVEFTVRDHEFYQRDEDDIYIIYSIKKEK